MKLKDYKLTLITVGLIGILLIATPALVSVIHLPSGEQFSELYLLGSGQTAENYPFNVMAGLNYSVYVDVGNHLGSSAYYILYLKFGNESDQPPNSTLETPSPLEPLYQQQFFIKNAQTWQTPLTFSFSDASISGTHAFIGKMTVNNISFEVNKPTNWDANNTGFYYTIYLELWRYNAQSNIVDFDNRFVSLHLNFTTGS